MDGFTRADGALACEGVSLDAIAARVGTPVYVYSAAMIRERYARLTGALADLPVHVHYSVKANSSLAILALLRSLGAGVDIVSGGELYRALAAGFTGADIVFSGVGKTETELEAALRAGVSSINVESEAELELLDAVARRLGIVARVALRVNPDVAVDTPHPYTRTGELGMKFGIPRDRVVNVARKAAAMSGVRVIGLAAHLGSQISEPSPYSLAADVLLTLKHAIERDGVTRIETLDAGGGLAVSYDGGKTPDLTAYANALAPLAEPGVAILIEPGRFLVAEAGVLLARVLYLKHSGGTDIVITDAGMNDLIRPALYEAYHGIDTVRDTGDETMRANVVGPVCESGDFFARDREIANVHAGDLIALRTVGAYGFTMASNYNSRPRPAEVLVDGDRFAVITMRESQDDLIRRETLTPTWMDG